MSLKQQGNVVRAKSASPYEAQCGFARALSVDGRLLVAGTAPIGPGGETVGAGDAYAQTRRCFAIVSEALEALGGSLDGVIRTRLYITDRAYWPEVARAHGELFGDVLPVATCVVVAGLLDADWMVEVEAEATHP